MFINNMSFQIKTQVNQSQFTQHYHHRLKKGWKSWKSCQHLHGGKFRRLTGQASPPESCGCDERGLPCVAEKVCLTILGQNRVLVVKLLVIHQKYIQTTFLWA